MSFIIVAVGAGIGGDLRYWISSLTYKLLPIYFPFGTLTVNLIGSFLLGILIFGFDEKDLLNPTLKLFLGIGFCGGFTTFSTFSLETFNLIRDSEYLLAGLNIFFSVLLTIIGIYIAHLITR